MTEKGRIWPRGSSPDRHYHMSHSSGGKNYISSFCREEKKRQKSWVDKGSKGWQIACKPWWYSIAMYNDIDRPHLYLYVVSTSTVCNLIHSIGMNYGLGLTLAPSLKWGMYLDRLAYLDAILYRSFGRRHGSWKGGEGYQGDFLHWLIGLYMKWFIVKDWNTSM